MSENTENPEFDDILDNMNSDEILGNMNSDEILGNMNSDEILGNMNSNERDISYSPMNEKHQVEMEWLWGIT